MKKVYSMKVAFLSIVLSGMMALALLVGGVSLWEISRFVQSSTKELITEKCEKEAAQLNEIFSGMEKSVRIMESYILDLVDSVENIRTSAGQDELVLQSNHFFGEVAKNTSNTVAYYFRFSPDFSENMGFFYSKVKGETGFVAFEPTDISLYPKDDKAHVGWYWEPYTAGTAIWITPYYNKNNDITMISFDYSIMTD